MYTNLNESLPIRLATYSQDGLGLGHMRRTHSIVGKFLQLCPNASALTLSDSPLGQFFAPAANHDYLKLPSIVKEGPGKWRANNLNMPFNVVSEMRQDLICRAMLSYRPHILLVDHMPHGAMGELLPTLAALRSSNIGTKVVLGLRDILDAPEVVQSRWQVEGAYDAVEQYYDRVLVYGMQGVFNMAKQYDFSPQMADLLRYSGYVCAPNDETSAPEEPSARPLTVTALRNSFLRGTNADAKLIVAMAGGGADAYPMMRTLLDAFPTIQRQQRSFLVMVTGPFMPAELREELKTRARGLPVRVLTSIDDTYSFLEAADLVVAMAGYNTTVEILQTSRRSILVPRRGPSAEQRTRTELFTDKGWIDMLDPDALTVANLASMVVKNLRLGPVVTAPTQPNLNGRENAAVELLSLLPTSTYAAAPMWAPEEYAIAEHAYELA